MTLLPPPPKNDAFSSQPWQKWFTLLRDVINGGNSLANPYYMVRVDSNGREVIQLNSAFGESLVAELHPQLQQSFEYTVSNTDLNQVIEVAGGTVTQADAMAVCSTSTTTASSARLKSQHHARYRPGLGGALRFSAIYSTPVAGTKQYVGIVDEVGSTATFLNGYAIGYNGTDFTIARFQNDSIIEVKQNDFDDPLDGTGSSGITLDAETLNVFYIQYQYLGAGAINYWMENPITGIPFIFHTEEYANKFTVPSTYNPNYHVQIYVSNGATTSNVTVKCGSYGYFIEGQTRLIEQYQPQNATGTIQKTTVTTEVALFTIRNKTTYASKTNYIDVILERVGSAIEASSTNNLGTVRIVKNATLGGTPSYTDISTTNPVIDYDVAGTTVTGGKELFAIELAGKNDRYNENLVPFDIIIHPGDTVTVAASSANSATIRASLLWKEQF